MSCKHQFMVSRWENGVGFTYANQFVCMYCLKTSTELNKDEVNNGKNQKSSKRSVSDKDDSHSDGKKGNTA